MPARSLSGWEGFPMVVAVRGDGESAATCLLHLSNRD